MVGSVHERRGFKVRGVVQGVGFRWWTRRTATALGVCGYVRNLRTGEVEVQAVGPRARLDDLERVLHVGPVSSVVEEVVIVASDPRAPTDSFHIKMA